MKILYYNDLDYRGLKNAVDKTIAQLQQGNFAAADAKKMQNTSFWRAKINDKARLLFQFAKFGQETYLLIFEVLPNHEYEKSIFLGGGQWTEEDFLPTQQAPQASDFLPLPYVHPKHQTFHFLNKVISFDELQSQLFQEELPLVLIGSAGSGKTALLLEKLKTLKGKILYLSLSNFLVHHAQELYWASTAVNEDQELDFLSFSDFLQQFKAFSNKPLTYPIFKKWISNYTQAYRIKDSYAVFEEFRGVLTGSSLSQAYLSREAYLNLGLRQSIFTGEERKNTYDLFEKYLTFIQQGQYHDGNLASFERLGLAQPQYDYVLVDEVQDFTPIQLFLALKSLKDFKGFLLCGDAHQVVHPNFFSWTQLKTMFHQHFQGKAEVLRILYTNYRNTPQVTQLANRLLKLKNARLGSVDRESTHLIEPCSPNQGLVEFLPHRQALLQDLNQKTNRSTQFAVLVLREEDKTAAKAIFKTPLLFSVQEAKGLEYPNIILYNLISSEAKAFSYLCQDISFADLEGDLKYNRAKDKTDKSLDAYKFYINALYVGMTRAKDNLFIVEEHSQHELLPLLGLQQLKQSLHHIKIQASSTEDWQREAQRLELQGKEEQAQAIRQEILNIKPVPWPVYIHGEKDFDELIQAASSQERIHKKALETLLDWCLIHNHTQLAQTMRTPAFPKADKAFEDWDLARKMALDKILQDYRSDKVKDFRTRYLQQYGANFRTSTGHTPLMLAVMAGAVQIIKELLSCGARLEAMEQYGRTAFQLALLQASQSRTYTEKVLTPCFKLLRPQQTAFKIANRVLNLQAHQAEFIILHYALAMMPEGLLEYEGKTLSLGFTAKDMENFFQKLPPHAIPEHFKERKYINKILSKNEAEKKGKMLFGRIAKGVYIFNPRLAILVDGEWKNLYNYTFLQRQMAALESSKGKDLCRIVEDPKWLAIENEAIRFFENNRKFKN